MQTGRAYRGTVIGLIAAVALSTTPVPVAACPRALYVAKDGTVIVGRSMDWARTFDKQLAIIEYWKDTGGTSKSLPGTSRAADRFVRTSFLP
jgi:penicillin V acylase-like amidase (Ntn superfamily)